MEGGGKPEEKWWQKQKEGEKTRARNGETRRGVRQEEGGEREGNEGQAGSTNGAPVSGEGQCGGHKTTEPGEAAPRQKAQAGGRPEETTTGGDTDSKRPGERGLCATLRVRGKPWQSPRASRPTEGVR